MSERKRDGVISAAHMAADSTKCPNCGSPEFTLEGKYQKRFRRKIIAGEEHGEEQEEGYSERFVAIDCQACKLRIEIEPDHVIQLIAENMDLKMKLAQQGGQAVNPGNQTKVM